MTAGKILATLALAVLAVGVLGYACVIGLLMLLVYGGA
jgi:hypothetical protein